MVVLVVKLVKSVAIHFSYRLTGTDPEILQGGWLVVLNYTDAWGAAG